MKRTVFLFIIVSIGLIGFYFYEAHFLPKVIVTNYQNNPRNLLLNNTEFIVKGVSMEPMIKNGNLIVADLNYYKLGKNTLTKGDIILFKNPFGLEKIIKRVGIVPGDKIIKVNSTHTLVVNNKLLVNSIGEPYIFDDLAYKWIDIYTKNGVIIDNTYFLYGDNINLSLDSRKIGPITSEGILGKVIIGKN